MLVERLESYFGVSEDSETNDFIIKEVAKYNEQGQDELYRWIVDNRAKRFGFPDISFMQKAFKAVRPSNARKYFWAVCSRCKSPYWYSMPFCPKCWDNGTACNSRAVKISPEKPQIRIARYNKDYTLNAEISGNSSGEKICYDCENRELSFCQHFGDYEYTCPQSDFYYCKCKQCCTEKKRNREKWDKAFADKNPMEGTPLPFKKVV